MSFIQAARDALKDLPVSEIAHERLSLALDRLAETEVKNEALTLEKNSLQAQLDRERRDHKQTCQDLQRLKDEHTEEARIYKMVEFRRGKRTGGKWVAFCPKCHLPAGANKDPAYGTPQIYCNDHHCGWLIYPGVTLEDILAELEH